MHPYLPVNQTRKGHDMTLLDDARTPAEPAAGWSEIAHQIGAEIAPAAAGHDAAGDFVFGSFDLLRERGITGMLVPADLGGGGATHGELCDVLRILGQSCGATAVTLSMHSHLVALQVWRSKHGQDAEKILRRVAGERIILVSTGAADWLESNGRAERVEGGYRVSGRKAPSSGAPVGDVLVTSFPIETDGQRQVIHCAVPFAADGVSIDETWDTLGLRATGSHTVVLDDVFVPDAAVSLVRPAGWHPIWNAILGVALPLIMSAYVGIAEAAAGLALEQARSKAEQPHIAPLVGEMGNALTTAQDAVNAMIATADDLRFANTDAIGASMLTRKSIAAEALVTAVHKAVDVAGGAGYSRHLPLERHFRDIHGGSYHPLPTPKQVRFTGRMALGLPPAG